MLVTSMPPKKLPATERKTARIEIMVEPSFVEKVEAEAKRLGQNSSSYIRLAIMEKMIRDGRAVDPDSDD
jgi:hypothetical protein